MIFFSQFEHHLSQRNLYSVCSLPMSNLKRVPFAFFFLAALLAFAIAAFPQDARAQDYLTDEGVTRLGGALSFTTQGGDYYAPGENDRLTTVNLNPSVQYFLAPGLAVGADALLEYQAQNDVSLRIFSIGPSASYFFGGADTRAYPFLSVNPLYTNIGRNEDSSINGFGVVGSIGGAFQIARNVAITAEGFYEYESFSTEGADERVSGNTFGLRVGVSAFLY